MPHHTLSAWFERLAPASKPADLAWASEQPGQPSPSPPERLLLSIARQAMACEFEVLLNQFQYPAAAERALEALDLIEQLEIKLSVYKPRSDLSTLNRWGPQRAVAVAADTISLLQLASDIHELTDGAFDITAGSLTDVWGFSRRQGQLPSESQIADALTKVGSKYLEIDVPARNVRITKPGVRVNPGGIGKGYALDRAALHLSTAGIDDFLLHGGLSSVIARGNRQHPATGAGWLVSLRHPWRTEEILGTIRLRDQALATSGSGKQFFHFGGKRYSHIIDPRSGQPAQTMLSATVICPSGAVADALATAFFVMGPEASRAFCAQHSSIAAIIVFNQQRTGRTMLETINTADGTWQPWNRKFAPSGVPHPEPDA